MTCDDDLCVGHRLKGKHGKLPVFQAGKMGGPTKRAFIHLWKKPGVTESQNDKMLGKHSAAQNDIAATPWTFPWNLFLDVWPVTQPSAPLHSLGLPLELL